MDNIIIVMTFVFRSIIIDSLFLIRNKQIDKNIINVIVKFEIEAGEINKDSAIMENIVIIIEFVFIVYNE